MERGDKHRQLVELRIRLRALEAELGTVVEDEPDGGTNEPRTMTAREQLLTHAERIAQVGSWAWHVASNKVHWSDEMYRIFGVAPSPGADLTALFFARIHPDDRAFVQASQGKLLTEGKVPPLEFRLLLPDGTERVVLTHSVTILDEHGKPARFVGTVHDLSALRAAERERVRYEEMLRAGEALAGVGSFRWKPATSEVLWSTELKRITGLPDGEAPTFEYFAKLLVPADRARLEESTRRALETGKTESMLVQIVLPDGTPRDLRLEGSFLPGNTEMLGAVLDVTAVRKLEAELFQAQKLEALGRLAGGIAHDFNNILAVLRLGLDSRGPETPLTRELGMAIDRGASLTRQLLAFGRKSMLEPRAVDVGELLRQSVTMVSRLLGDAVQARLDLTEDALVVYVDPLQLEHTFINLMANARDAMPSGGTIWLSARPCNLDRSPVGVHPPLDPGAYVEVTVRDEGAGISEAVLPHIFEPFFTTKPSGQGTGLGLASVFGTVSQSRGGVAVMTSSTGSTFQLYLPRSSAPATELGSGTDVVRLGRGERVVVLDDLPALRRAMVAILSDAGYDVVEATDPAALVEDAAEIARTCAAVVTDVDMPGLSGPDVARALWRHAPHLPVLFISGHPRVVVPSEGDARRDLLGKPFAAAELVDRLSALLTRPS